MNTHRRSFLKFGLAAFSTLAGSALWPLRVLAAATRPASAFTAKTVDEVYKVLGGKPTPSKDIDFKTPDIAENGAVVPITVTSKLPDTEEIMVLIEKNPNPLAAIFVVPEGTAPKISTRVKVSQSGQLTAIVKAGGKLYSTSSETKVTLGGCGG